MNASCVDWALSAFLKRLEDLTVAANRGQNTGGDLRALTQAANTIILVCKPEERCLFPKQRLETGHGIGRSKCYKDELARDWRATRSVERTGKDQDAY